MTLVQSGADIVLLRHPSSFATMNAALDDLMKGA